MAIATDTPRDALRVRGMCPRPEGGRRHRADPTAQAATGGRRMSRLRASWEYVRGTYWAVPSAMSVAAVLRSIGIQLDQAATPKLLNRLSWVYAGDPEGARAVLSTIAASMITVAGVVRNVPLSDSDRELIVQCHRAALDVVHAPLGDQLPAS